MHLCDGGMDIFYIDESHDRNIYAMTAINVPFLRQVEGRWTFVWNNHFQGAKTWRRFLKNTHSIPTTRELHGVDLAAGRGNYFRGKHNFKRPKAGAVYRNLLSAIDFIPDASVMTSVARREDGNVLYGRKRLEAALYALLQRMRKKCETSNINAITFFDQGHPEYRKLYRQAQVYLPTGSQYERGTRNLPLDMFTKDANEKDSKHCFFTQVADMIAYSAFLKIKSERGELEDWQQACSLHNLYNSLPNRLLNTRVSNTGDGIKRL